VENFVGGRARRDGSFVFGEKAAEVTGDPAGPATRLAPRARPV